MTNGILEFMQVVHMLPKQNAWNKHKAHALKNTFVIDDSFEKKKKCCTTKNNKEEETRAEPAFQELGKKSRLFSWSMIIDFNQIKSMTKPESLIKLKELVKYHDQWLI